MRSPQPTTPRLRARCNAGAIALALLLLPAVPARADLETVQGATSLAQVVQIPQPVPSGGALGTAFTSFSGQTFPYSMGTFFVGADGMFTFKATSGLGAPLGVFIVRGIYADPANGGIPSAPPSSVVAGAIGSPLTLLSNIQLSARQQYTYVITTAFNTPDGWRLSVLSQQCIFFGSTNACAAVQDGGSAFSSLYGAGMDPLLWDMQSQLFDLLGGRLDALRYAADGNDAALVAYSLDAPGSGRAAAGSAPRQGFWVRALGTRSTQNASAVSGGYAARGWGFSAGYDREVAPRTVLGVALTYAEDAIGYQQQWSGQGTSIKSYHAAAYASRRFDMFYTDAMAGYARQRYGTHRDAFDGSDTGNFSGNLWSVRLSAGIPLRVAEGYTLTPQARADYFRLDRQGYTENGGASALAFEAMQGERIRSGVGAQLAYSARLGSLKTQPYLNAFWNHDFHNNGLAGNATQGGISFQVQGAPLPRNTYSTGIGASFLVNQRFSALLSLDHEAGSGYKSDTARLAGRWAF